MYILNYPYKEIFDPTHAYVFTAPCVACGKTLKVYVPAEGLFRYHQGGLIQNCFPEMSPQDREFLLTGMCPLCWDSMFGEPGLS